MLKKVIFSFLLGIFILFLIPGVLAIDITFNSAGTQTINIQIPYSQISEIVFNITGFSSGETFPTNVSIDIGNDGSADWEFKPRHSNSLMTLSSISSAWSSNPNNANIVFADLQHNVEMFELTGLGSIKTNVFSSSGNSKANSQLGITSIDSINEQIISINTDRGFVHAFVPAIDPEEGTIGLYVAQGGTTYYCNSDHTFSFTATCNLSPAQALVAGHIARQANQPNFDFKEILKDDSLTEIINEKIAGCSNPPCLIPVSISSESAGTVNIEFSTLPANTPAEISIIESSDSYAVSISTLNTLNNVSYFFGTMPRVYVVPVVAGDDSLILSENQKKRIIILNNTLANSWDLLTNYSHPLNFTFYTEPQKLNNFRAFHDYNRFQYEVHNQLIPSLNVQSPAIVILLDVRDYFQNYAPSNTKRMPSGSPNGVIADIYINGFADTSKTSLYKYDDEILTNVVLHELMHSFIEYPAGIDGKLFHSGHPSSFTDITDFITYNSADSPTGNEGYFEIYSIMNQIRIYLTKEEASNKNPELSPLDKMLLGTLSNKIILPYTFYSTTITKLSDRYLSGNINLATEYNANKLYKLSDDLDWWDVRFDSSYVNKGTSSSFSIPKSGQNGRGIWVFASDLGNEGHFKVFSNNAKSSQASKNNISSLVIINGVCGTSVDSCSQGTSSDIEDSQSNYLWRCVGINGGTTAQCSIPISQFSPTIIIPPRSQMAHVGDNVTFSVVASGSTPLNYQWQKNGVSISGETSQSYTTTALTVSNSGDTYRAIVTNSYGSTQSKFATITVKEKYTSTEPTFIQEAETAWNSGSSPKNTGSFEVQKGDVLVAYSATASDLGDVSISGGSLIWTEQQRVNYPGHSKIYIWTAIVDTNKSMSVSFTGREEYIFGGNVLTFRGSDGIGNTEGIIGTDSTPNLNLITTQPKSAIILINADKNSIGGNSRIWLESVGTFSEQTYFNDSERYTIYGGYYPNSGIIGNYSVGLLSPNGQNYSIAALEIRGIQRMNNLSNYHPADSNGDFILGADEFTEYNLAFKMQQTWPSGPSPPSINYYTRSLLIFRTGERYSYDSSLGCPNCLKSNNESYSSAVSTMSEKNGFFVSLVYGIINKFKSAFLFFKAIPVGLTGNIVFDRTSEESGTEDIFDGESYANYRDIVNFEDKDLSYYGRISKNIRVNDRIFFRVADEKYFVEIVEIENEIVKIRMSDGDEHLIMAGSFKTVELDDSKRTYANIAIEEISQDSLGKEAVLIVSSSNPAMFNKEKNSLSNVEILSKNYQMILIISPLVLTLILLITYRKYIIKNKKRGKKNV